jgi:hypothetical protein
MVAWDGSIGLNISLIRDEFRCRVLGESPRFHDDSVVEEVIEIRQES